MVSELSETSHGVGSLPNLYVHDYAYVWRGLAWTLVMCLAPSIDEWIWADLGIEYSKLWICLLEKCVACSTELTCTYWMNFSIYQEWIWPFLFRDFDTLICGGRAGFCYLSLEGERRRYTTKRKSRVLPPQKQLKINFIKHLRWWFSEILPNDIFLPIVKMGVWISKKKGVLSVYIFLLIHYIDCMD